MKLRALTAAAMLLFVGISAVSATECNDGTYSNSSGSGTCSHHGGERK